MKRTEKSYTEATLVMLGGGGDQERVPVIMASPDRIRTQRKYAQSQRQAIEKGKGEEWVAHAFYLAWKRSTGRDLDFEKWLDSFIGFEEEVEVEVAKEAEPQPDDEPADDADEDPSGEAQTPA